MNDFVKYCNDNCLSLNVKKTKEMIFEFRQSNHMHAPVSIDGEDVGRVSTYKYLGTLLDDKLNFSTNTDLICCKAIVKG